MNFGCLVPSSAVVLADPTSMAIPPINNDFRRKTPLKIRKPPGLPAA
jgi:hypothetical protein